MKNRNDMIVLLLEDQPLIAMDTEAMLKQIGFACVTQLASFAAALAFLSASTPDLVVMEITLGGQSCAEFARALIGRGIPFILYTGASRKLASGEKLLLDAEWLSKPSEPEIIDAVVGRLLAPA